MTQFRHAFSLDKQELNEMAPPGTVTLMDRELVRTNTGHHEVEENHIHLNPEPSPDPADPLNFSNTRKVMILAIMALYAFITNVSSSIISSALPTLVTAFMVMHERGPPTGIIQFSTLTHLIAVNNLFLGASNTWWVPLGNTFGRRPIILICLAILCASSVWAGEAKSFNSLLVARLFQGIGGGAADTLAPDVVGQIFFVHQRGRAMAIYTIFLASGSLVGGLIGGYITHSMGWRWTMYISAILSGALLLLSFFFVPETLFDREAAMAIVRPEGYDNDSPIGEKAEIARVETVNSVVFPKYTFARSLKVGMYRPGLLKRFITPYTTLLFPGTWMVMLHYAGLVGLIVTLSTVAPQILAQPPYLWGGSVGLINVGGLIGTVLGAIYTYFTADFIVKRQAKRERHGFSEPEARIPLMFPALLIATAGSICFGCSAQAATPKAWIGLEFGAGMVAFGLMQVPSIGFNYIIESYGGWSADCFLMVVAFRAIISFAWTFFVGTWVESAGPALPFGIFALLMGVFGLTAVPVWLFGKRLRIATSHIVMRGYAKTE
ncbi:MFS general substrate transporter [Aureobasidium pullulans EXF-150]|uniref:MFS general substrate transporter n=1 Tax=Aureobasidium pullulans EXF-150 TaxID=1043002 RepID=A0A074Y7B1_AURPU|nr:MFS general substrate transporter [Aureobasidium pullulans EXF-150]KEQ82771.1 MFS general substrate transporter [Aureobasidium pullulans EXF-150]